LDEVNANGGGVTSGIVFTPGEQVAYETEIEKSWKNSVYGMDFKLAGSGEVSRKESNLGIEAALKVNMSRAASGLRS
jgi:hypothetical protein